MKLHIEKHSKSIVSSWDQQIKYFGSALPSERDAGRSPAMYRPTGPINIGWNSSNLSNKTRRKRSDPIFVTEPTHLTTPQIILDHNRDRSYNNGPEREMEQGRYCCREPDLAPKRDRVIVA